MKLYHKLANWWHVLSAPEDYAEEAGLYWQIISRYKTDIQTALELGCGGGNNALHLKQHCQWTLTDLSEPMINQSRKINPECEHVVGDMRTLRLGRRFDLVFIHDAIMLMRTTEELQQVFETAKAHLQPDGLLFIAPDFFAETFRPTTHQGGHDGPDRGIRYLEWTFLNDRQEVETQYVYLLRHPSGEVECERDLSIGGIFSRQIWEDTLRRTGFSVTFERIDHSELPADSYYGIVARPAGIDAA